MEIYCGLTFENVTEEDVEILTTIMKRAFDEDARIHLGDEAGGPPGYDNGEFIRKWYLNSDADAYKVLQDGVMIGAVNVFHQKEHEYYLGNMFTDSAYHDKGLGTIIWHFVEQKYADARIWRTETPGFSKRNHHFYINKCGFNVVRIDNPKDRYEESYILEKLM
ncbi:MAG: GNAT family N-acetyltransferase [Christensenellaceae bacterium]|jgi:hypothetical protein|nr:GNAT family N-acetyltransferase [Christensenellaceae bacterium]